MIKSIPASFSVWENATKVANVYFERLDFGLAEKKYLRAKTLSIELFKRKKQAERAIAALVVSHHNLANLYQKQGRIKRAHQELESVDTYLNRYLDNGIDNIEVMRSVQMGINQTRSELLSFIKENKLIVHDVTSKQQHNVQH